MVFVMLLMIGFGCSKETKVVNTPTVAQDIDNKTLEVKSQILAPWEERKKNFWISVYFARMSYQPNIRERFLPHILYGVCECIIDELEKSKRKMYAGSIGYFSANKNFDTCIALRTAIIKNNKFYIQSGAGIVADSVPEKEYLETVNKAKALINSLY